MIIVLCLFAVFVVSIVAWRVFRSGSYEDMWYAAPMTCGIILVIVLSCVVATRAGTTNAMLRFESARATLLAARENTDISDLELATIQRDVLECNQWLASTQYWAANPWTSWFHRSAVLKLKAIR